MRVLTCLSFLFLLSLNPALAQTWQIEAPGNAHIRQDIEVNWTASEARGDMLEIRPASGEGRRLSYAYLQGNPQMIMVPEAPGSYVLVYVSGGEIRASQPLSVTLPDASISAPAAVSAGEAVSVDWTGPVSRSDRLTFAARDGEPIRGTSYAYVGNLRGGPASMRAPADAGSYDLVYVSGSTILARTPIEVGGIEATLSAPTEVFQGGPVRVGWVGPENSQDRITFAARDGEPLAGASYTYVGNAGADDNAILTASETLGSYDIVYVSGGRVIGRTPIEVVAAHIDLGAPDQTRAYEQFTAIWSGTGNQGDRIDMRDASGALASFRYIDPNTPNVVIGAPAEPGDYTLIYLTRGGREMARRAISVLPPPAEPGQLLVEYGRAALGPEDAVGVILDASGSMLQRVGTERRIAIARNTLTGLVNDAIPEGTGFALRVFGHREPDSCRTDLEIPLAPLDPATASGVIAGINAMNLARTPLGRSIELTASDLAGAAGKRILIVLTDGEETCSGDAAAAIQGLRDRGWDIRVNIVGFAIDDDALEAEFRAWAASGGGDYFGAADEAELIAALTRAVTGPYEVVDPVSGEAIATARSGELLTLAAGHYVIRWGNGGETGVDVMAGDVTRLTLE
ncbi:VWA domain-containing protein [uncultured Maricaulis sp.]|uniref:vWA domain-containing protein n=1 Tax=uncultured Maricaulis sp. TaxID=174710 RepID=UPI002612CCE4|nr:VWA domain-containing protein [uncultured Maricaulis sp.]